MQLVIGVDLGGTNLRARAYYEDGSPASERFETLSYASSGTEKILSNMAEFLTKIANSCTSPVAKIGIAVPGHIDSNRGIVVWAPNFGETIDGIFHYWENISLGPELSHRVGIPVVLGNDANLAALGEYRYGLGQNSESCFVLLTIGTGVGGGVIFGPGSLVGKSTPPLMLVGNQMGGAELGHVVVQSNGLDCNAGSYGAIEAYCGVSGIVNRALHRLKRGRKSIIRELCGSELSQVGTQMIATAAHSGDELAIEVYREVGEMLGVAIGSYINVFAPSLVAIGGQGAKAGDILIGPARSAAQNVAIPSLFAACRIEQAIQIDDAGILGGAALAAME